MTEVRFYHLTRTPLEAALPAMLERTLARDARAVVVAPSEERVEFLADHLWRYREKGFLPHGSKRDGYAEDQPIWLTVEDENPNGASYLFLLEGALSDKIERYQLVAFLFGEADENVVTRAREQWKGLKDAGLWLTYWQQDARGAWQKASEANAKEGA